VRRFNHGLGNLIRTPRDSMLATLTGTSWTEGHAVHM